MKGKIQSLKMGNTAAVCVAFKMVPLLLLILGSMGSSRADICKGQWESSEEGKMVAMGSMSVSPSLPFIIDFDQFAELGEQAKNKNSIIIPFITFVIIVSANLNC